MGNIDSKLTPYYSIIEEKPYYNEKNDISLNDLKKFGSIWSIKKVKFSQENKNSLLFELESNRQEHQKLALNQIKSLKTLRHPNIVKYYYSEEQPKCILITESLRPLVSLMDDLSKEQVIRGLYGITNAILFLHEKVFTSHNNLNASCINLNAKQTWKLNNFELSLGFTSLNKQNLKQIYEFKDKNCVTPEEEMIAKDLGKDNMDIILKDNPHCIDSYGWGMLIVRLLYPKNQVTSKTNIIDDDDEDYSLEDYLSNDPAKRPTIKSALEMGFFDVCKPKQIKSDQLFDPFKIHNLNDLEINFENLVQYLKNLIQLDVKTQKKNLDENLIDFLLSPIMFFSQRIRSQVLPCILIPNEIKEKSLVNNFYLYKNWNLNKNLKMEEVNTLEPFLDVDKYKAFVLPRILSLFTMRSVQIRLVLLEFFPFYIGLINDVDTLKYEILPELLVGLKDKNDEIVTFTFSCLSIMVKLLGRDVVVGKPNSKNKHSNSYFTENIPKSIQYPEARVSSSNSLDDMNEIINSNKIFSDSMIALHDDTESVKSYNQNMTVNGIDEEKSSNEWLNDWDQEDVNSKQNVKVIKPESSASLVSLAGSIKQSNSILEMSKHKSIGFYSINESMGAEYDIKSINVKKLNVKDPDEDLIENFLNEMKPNLESKPVINGIDVSSLMSNGDVKKSDNLWECGDDEINLDEL